MSVLVKCPRCKASHAGERKTCDRCRAKNRLWHQENQHKPLTPERRRELNKKYAARSAEKNRARVKAWRAANPDRVRVNENRTRARRMLAPSLPFTAELLAQRMLVYSRCWVCGDPKWSQVDHVKPLARGGPHMLANLRPICKPCNISKAATWPFDTSISARR